MVWTCFKKYENDWKENIHRNYAIYECGMLFFCVLFGQSPVIYSSCLTVLEGIQLVKTCCSCLKGTVLRDSLLVSEREQRLFLQKSGGR